MKACIVAEWGACGLGHKTRAEALADSMGALGVPTIVVKEPIATDLVLYDTPERPLLGRPLRRAFWKRCLLAFGGTNIRNLALDLPGLEVRPIRGDARMVREQMEWADVAVSTGGQTLNELMSLDVPTVVVEVGGDGERENVEHFRDRLVAVYQWDDPDLEPKVRHALEPWTDEGVQIAQRIICHIRPATWHDVPFLFELANEVRPQSFHTEAIEWHIHVKWCWNNLCAVQVVEHNGERVGMVRFDGDEISLALTASARGKGIGGHILRQVAREGTTARVRTDNTASKRLFESAGFSLVGGDENEAVYEMRHARHEARPHIRCGGRV